VLVEGALMKLIIWVLLPIREKQTRGICDSFVGFSDKGKTLETM
jgi:hypothetical protein